MEKVVGTFDVGSNEGLRIFDASIDVTLGGEIDDDVAAVKNLDDAGIENVHLHELQSLIVGDGF
jgi:hypothetical protein